VALRSEITRCLSISVLSLALGGALVGCGQTGPLYLPPEPDVPDEEIDTVVDTEVGAEAGLEAGIQDGRDGGPMGDTAITATSDDAAVDSDVIIETEEDASSDSEPGQ